MEERGSAFGGVAATTGEETGSGLSGSGGMSVGLLGTSGTGGEGGGEGGICVGGWE